LPTTPHCKQLLPHWQPRVIAASRDNHHYRVIQSLEFTIAPGEKTIATLDMFRKKRNISSYDVADSVSDLEANEMFRLAKQLRTAVEKWLRASYPELIQS